MAYVKNDDVGVRNLDNDKIINGKIIDVAGNKIWVRLPTQTVIQFSKHEKTGQFLGKMAGLELVLV